MRTRRRMRGCVYVYTRIGGDRRARIHTRAHAHARRHTHTRAERQAHMHARTHAHVHSTPTRTHAHTHALTRARVQRRRADHVPTRTAGDAARRGTRRGAEQPRCASILPRFVNLIRRYNGLCNANNAYNAQPRSDGAGGGAMRFIIPRTLYKRRRHGNL
jgi:hypothetical protein